MMYTQAVSIFADFGVGFPIVYHHYIVISFIGIMIAICSAFLLCI